MKECDYVNVGKTKKMVVHQVIEQLDSDAFEGTFEQVIGNLQKIRDRWIPGELYLCSSPKSKAKQFAFDSFEIEHRQAKWEDNYYYYVIGVRELDEQEKDKIKEETSLREQQNKEYRRKQFEQMKREFGE